MSLTPEAELLKNAAFEAADALMRQHVSGLATDTIATVRVLVALGWADGYEAGSREIGTAVRGYLERLVR